MQDAFELLLEIILFFPRFHGLIIHRFFLMHLEWPGHVHLMIFFLFVTNEKCIGTQSFSNSCDVNYNISSSSSDIRDPTKKEARAIAAALSIIIHHTSCNIPQFFGVTDQVAR